MISNRFQNAIWFALSVLFILKLIRTNSQIYKSAKVIGGVEWKRGYRGKRFMMQYFFGKDNIAPSVFFYNY